LFDEVQEPIFNTIEKDKIPHNQQEYFYSSILHPVAFLYQYLLYVGAENEKNITHTICWVDCTTAGIYF
jgi:hypothetical protein